MEKFTVSNIRLICLEYIQANVDKFLHWNKNSAVRHNESQIHSLWAQTPENRSRRPQIEEDHVKL